MKKIIIIFLLFFVSQLVGAGLALVFGQDPVTIGLCVGVAEVLLIAVLSFFGLLSTKRPVSDSFRKGMPKLWWLALIGFMFFSIGINFLVAPLDLPDLGMEAQFEAMRDSWLCIFILAVIAPWAEELVFRDGILRAMLQSGTNKWLAIACSAIAFGLVHGDPAQMIPAMALGVLLGWLYFSTGDLRLCLPAHILNNSLAIVFMAYPEIDASIDNMSVATCIISGLVTINAGLGMLERYHTRQTK